MDYGKNFRRAREKKGISQKDAAAALDISPAFLSNVENNKKKPNLDLMLKAAKLYGVDKTYLLNEQDEIDIEKEVFTKSNREFIKNIESMSLDEIIENYNIKLDEKTLTPAEVKALIAFVRQMRSV